MPPWTMFREGKVCQGNDGSHVCQEVRGGEGGHQSQAAPVDRAVFQADFRARSYAGVTSAFAAGFMAPESWERLIRIAHTKAAGTLLMEHPALDALLDRLAGEPNVEARVRLMRDELGPWLYEYVPAVNIGPVHSIVGVGARVGEWPLVPGHLGLHNWEYVTHGH